MQLAYQGQKVWSTLFWYLIQKQSLWTPFISKSVSVNKQFGIFFLQIFRVHGAVMRTKPFRTVCEGCQILHNLLDTKFSLKGSQSILTDLWRLILNKKNCFQKQTFHSRLLRGPQVSPSTALRRPSTSGAAPEENTFFNTLNAGEASLLSESESSGSLIWQDVLKPLYTWKQQDTNKRLRLIKKNLS